MQSAEWLPLFRGAYREGEIGGCKYGAPPMQTRDSSPILYRGGHFSRLTSTSPIALLTLLNAEGIRKRNFFAGNRRYGQARSLQRENTVSSKGFLDRGSFLSSRSLRRQ